LRPFLVLHRRPAGKGAQRHAPYLHPAFSLTREVNGDSARCCSACEKDILPLRFTKASVLLPGYIKSVATW
jgi:hypothetical protein